MHNTHHTHMMCTSSYLLLISDSDLSEQRERKGEDVVQTFISERAGHLPVLGQ